MKTIITSIMTGALGTAAWLVVSTGNAQPQDRPQPGNFDPQQMRQRMMERMRDQLEVKDDAEWKAISERIDKVMQTRRSIGGGGPGGFGGAGGRAGQGGPGGPPTQRGQGGPDNFGPPPGDAPGGPGQAQGSPQGVPPEQGQFRNRPGGPGGMGGFARESNPEMDALRKAIEDKASASEIKAKLAALRAARAKKEAELDTAQEELRKILSARQEAVAVTLGLLK